MNGERLDEKDVHTAYKALASAEENLTVLRAKILNEVMPVLTPDQQTTIKNKIAKMSLRAQKTIINLQSKLNTLPPVDQYRVPPGGGVFPFAERSATIQNN